MNDRIKRVEYLRIKFSDLTNSVAPRARRSRRGACNFEGKNLHWLFGVPAQADLERVSRKLNNVTKRTSESAHLADVQANLISEALKESHMTLQGLRNFSAAYSVLSSSLQAKTRLSKLTKRAKNSNICCCMLSKTGKLLFPGLRLLCKVLN